MKAKEELKQAKNSYEYQKESFSKLLEMDIEEYRMY